MQAGFTFALPIFLAFAIGCAATAPPPQATLPVKGLGLQKVRKIELEPIRLEASAVEGGEPRIEVLDAHTLFDDGGRMLSQKKYATAIQYYDKLLEKFPQSKLVGVSLYNAGLANEALADYAKAASYYEQLIRSFPRGRDAGDAAFRLGACYAELKRWSESAKVFGLLAQRPEIGVGDRLEALARQGLALFQQGDYAETKATLRKALRYHRSVAASERLDTDFFLAMIHYYLAALPHREYREAPMTPGAKLALQLDNKARLLLSAQAAYINTIKVKNGYWAAAAGFQIGSLYREFYNLLMTTLPNFDEAARKNAKKAKISVDQAQADLKRIYLEEVHKKVKVLLQKAIRVYEKNLLMAQRVGVQSNWVRKTRMEIDELRHLLTVSPAEAVKEVPRQAAYPEDEVTGKAPLETPAEATSRPAPAQPPEPELAAPGRIVL